MVSNSKEMKMSLIWFIIFLVDHVLCLIDCNTSTCGSYGPAVRFPFRIKGRQPLHCGYPQTEFHHSCSEKNDTVLELTSSWKLLIQKIDYKSQVIYANDPEGCLPRRLSNFSLSVSPFHFMDYAYELTLFNCSSKGDSDPILCLSSPQYQVYAVYSASSIGAFDLLSCTKIRDISPVPYDYLRYQQRILRLSWDNPKCKDCEVKGKYCRLKSNNTASETQCYGMLVFKPHKGNSSTPSSSCCSQLASVVQSRPQCLCAMLNGGGSSLGITINQTQALSLPGACNVQTPPVSQCNAANNSPAIPPIGSLVPSDSSDDSPKTPNTPSLPSIPAGSGSKTVPTAGGTSAASLTRMQLHLTIFIIFIASCISNGIRF
ncbi:hypothetical protein GH714_010319 [Hevea brasiliensis]|uniref:RING-type E3 ubiquitin transferase n=1 Tax=Hevea brasiliensis TaxID=3981 RepID=A0A6A6LKK1_HEVBR|nr:hypothetical protein GH714_010319 [Hevea brasiliensis]